VSAGWLSAEEAEAFASSAGLGGFDANIADSMSENVIGVHGLPLGVCLNLLINGQDRVAPMAIEEPSVVAAASGAARLVRGEERADADPMALELGFFTETSESLMAAQIQLTQLKDTQIAKHQLAAEEPFLIESANALIPRMVARGGGARSLELRELQRASTGRADGVLCVHVLVDCLDAMGANLLNTVAEGLAPLLSELTGGAVGLRILSNYADRRLVRVRCRIAPERLTSPGWPDGGVVRDRIIAASKFAEADPYRAVTHNKGFMNGLDAVLVATGQDWRQAEAAAHAYASRSGVYSPIAVWREGKDATLEGTAELPLAVGTVGGAARAHPGVRLALSLARAADSKDLASLAASVGLASNLAALKALATEGIQRGHMGLHSRTVAIEAGASGDEIHEVAAALAEHGSYDLPLACSILLALREAKGSEG